MNLLQILAAYIVADAITALYHVATDLGYNIPYQVQVFQNHHHDPLSMTFDLEPVLAGVPLVVLGFWFAPWFLIPLGIFVSVAQIPHYYAHFPYKAPKWFKKLQDWEIVIEPAAHDSHHSGEFDKDYCVLSGWNNFWINRLAAKLQRFKR